MIEIHSGLYFFILLIMFIGGWGWGSYYHKGRLTHYNKIEFDKYSPSDLYIAKCPTTNKLYTGYITYHSDNYYFNPFELEDVKWNIDSVKMLKIKK